MRPVLAGLTHCDSGGQTQLQVESNLRVAKEILLDFSRLLPTEGCSLFPCIELKQFANIEAALWFSGVWKRHRFFKHKDLVPYFSWSVPSGVISHGLL